MLLAVLLYELSSCLFYTSLFTVIFILLSQSVLFTFIFFLCLFIYNVVLANWKITISCRWQNILTYESFCYYKCSTSYWTLKDDFVVVIGQGKIFFFLVRNNILFFIEERGKELQRYIWDTMKLLGDTASFASFLFWENLWELVQNKTQRFIEA